MDNLLLQSPVVAFHALAALFVLAIGPVQIFRRRRDRVHKAMGRAWVAAMAATCVSSFWIHPDGFSWLHALSLFTMAMVALGVVSAVRGNIQAHRGNMVGSYLGTLGAFAWAAFAPNRSIAQLATGQPLTVAGVLVLVAAVTVSLFLSFRRPPRPAPPAHAPAEAGKAATLRG